MKDGLIQGLGGGFLQTPEGMTGGTQGLLGAPAPIAMSLGSGPYLVLRTVQRLLYSSCAGLWVTTEPLSAQCSSYITLSVWG